jgi:hypothetical protein
MALKLSEQEINQRLRNLEHLYALAQKRIVLQAEQITLLKQQVVLLQEQNKQKDIIIASMQLQLEEIKIKVFGKKNKKDDDEPTQRQKAVRESSSYQRPIPEVITKEEHHPINNCVVCDTPLIKKRTIVYYEEDMVLEKTKESIKHTVEQGYCNHCKKWISAVTLPSATCIIGTKLRKYICYLSIILRLSHQQIQEHISDIHQINVSQGEIQKILEKEAIQLRPEFERLKERIQQQKGQHYDETSWKVSKGIQGNFAWIMTGTETPEAVFLLGKSRGGGNIDTLNPITAIGITDDYGAYRKQFTHHQLCWAHLYRKFRDLAESEVVQDKELCLENYEKVSSIYRELKEILPTTFDYETTHTHFVTKLTELAQPQHDDFKKLKTIKESLLKNIEKYLTLLEVSNYCSSR